MPGSADNAQPPATPAGEGRSRYLMVSDVFWPARVYGGPVYSNLNLCRGLMELGHGMRVLTTDANRDQPLDVPLNETVEPFPGVEVVYHRVNGLGTGLNLVSPALLARLWREMPRAERVLVQGLYNLLTPLTVLFGRLRGKPVVISPRGALAEELIALRRSRAKRLWLRLLLRPLVGRALWHATSEQERQEILLRFPGARVMVVPNGLDLDDCRELPTDAPAALRRRFSLGEDEAPLLVSLGRIHRKKGLDVLIRAFHSLLAEFPAARLLIAGADDQGELARLQALVHELGLESRVSFTGALEGADKRLLLSGADLFVLPSQNENFGMVYAEALACGTPIVASLKTPWQQVESMGCGRWVANSVEATATAMAELLRDDPAAAGARGRAWVMEELDYRRVSARFHAELTQLMNG